MRNNRKQEEARFALPGWLTLLFGVLVLGILIGGYLFYHAQELHLRQASENELTAISQLKVDQIAAWRAERLGDASVFTKSPFFIEGVVRWMAGPQAGNTEQILTWFRTLQEHYSYYGVLLVDAGGQVRLSLSGSPGALHAEAVQAIADALRERRPVLTDLHAGPGDLPPHIDVIAPFFAGNGQAREPVGALILRSDAQKFLYPLIQSWPVPSQSAETLLVRREGDHVLFLNELRHRQDTALKFTIPLTQTDVPSVMAVLGKEGIVEGIDYRGAPVLSALKRVPDSPWYMVAKVDTAETFAILHTQTRLILVLIGGLLAATVGVGATLWQQTRKKHYQALYQAETERLAERERANAEREMLLQALREKNEEMESILYASSHDLRSPLVNIQGFSQRLEKACAELAGLFDSAADTEALRQAALPILQERMPAALRYIVASAAKMDTLINGLLRLSRLGRAPLNPVLLDMNKLMEAVVSTLAHLAHLAQAEISIDSLPGCWGDAALINQVFTNLLDNAIKYRAVDRPLRVHISGQAQDTMAIYCVEDNGAGIKAAHQDKIWGLFYRLDPQGGVAGEGLGLNTVKRIIQRHGGRVWLESEVGKGSRFFVALPREAFDIETVSA